MILETLNAYSSGILLALLLLSSYLNTRLQKKNNELETKIVAWEDTASNWEKEADNWKNETTAFSELLSWSRDLIYSRGFQRQQDLPPEPGAQRETSSYGMSLSLRAETPEERKLKEIDAKLEEINQKLKN